MDFRVHQATIEAALQLAKLAFANHRRGLHLQAFSLNQEASP
jgi:hypothetical protein